MQASSPVISHVLQTLASHWSLLLLLCIGIAYSVFKFNSAKSAAILAAVGMTVVLFVDLLSMGLSALLMRKIVEGTSSDRSQWISMMALLNILLSLVRTAGWGAVIAAVYVGRPNSSYSKGPSQ